MTAPSKHVQIMEEMLQYVKKIKVVNPANHKDVTSTLKCLNALQIALKSTLEVWKAIQGVCYISVYKTSQPRSVRELFWIHTTTRWQL